MMTTSSRADGTRGRRRTSLARSPRPRWARKVARDMSGRNQHYLPAIYLAGFAEERRENARDSLLWAGRRGGRVFRQKAANVGATDSLYTIRKHYPWVSRDRNPDGLDDHWSHVEQRLQGSVDALLGKRPSGILEAGAWLMLAKFVAQLFGPCFTHRRARHSSPTTTVVFPDYGMCGWDTSCRSTSPTASPGLESDEPVRLTERGLGHRPRARLRDDRRRGRGSERASPASRRQRLWRERIPRAPISWRDDERRTATRGAGARISARIPRHGRELELHHSATRAPHEAARGPFGSSS